MTIAEFYLIKSTSTITLSVAGISKEIVIISLSVLIYGDKLTPVNLLGYVGWLYRADFLAKFCLKKGETFSRVGLYTLRDLYFHRPRIRMAHPFLHPPVYSFQ